MNNLMSFMSSLNFNTDVCVVSIPRITLEIIPCATFLNCILSNIEIIRNDEVQTIANDGEEIFYNYEYFKSLTFKQQASLLIHEASHIALLHSYRAKKIDADPLAWNIAADYVVNDALEKYTDKSAFCTVGLPCPDEFKNRTTEYIYKKLKKTYTDGQLQVMANQSFEMKGSFDILPPKMFNHEEINSNSYIHIADVITAAYTCAHDVFGNRVDTSIKAIDNYPKSNDQWKKQLINYCLSFKFKNDEVSYKTPCRRLVSSSIHLPGATPKSDKMNVNVYIESTCDNEIVQTALNCLSRIFTDIELETMSVHTFDSEITNKKIYSFNTHHNIKKYTLNKTEKDADINCVMNDILKHPSLFNIVITGGEFNCENLVNVRNQSICWVICDNPDLKVKGKCIYVE